MPNITEITIRRQEPEKWIPVWWLTCYGKKGQRIRAIAGNPSRTGKTIRIRAQGIGGMIERSVKPKNLEPRSTTDGEADAKS
jgi:hypothetical protein